MTKFQIDLISEKGHLKTFSGFQGQIVPGITSGALCQKNAEELPCNETCRMHRLIFMKAMRIYAFESWLQFKAYWKIRIFWVMCLAGVQKHPFHIITSLSDQAPAETTAMETKWKQSKTSGFYFLAQLRNMKNILLNFCCFYWQ